jgi:hypothetical protein
MNTRSIAIATALAALAFGHSAQAMTAPECSAKYKAAKDGGTLNGMKWNDFRKSQCADAAATPAAVPAAAPAAPPAKQATTPPPAKTAAPSPAATGNAIFPTAVSPKYSSETPGKARMHTCLDQYNANKTNNGNGGLTWIAKGGGYYSECNKHLKG